MPKNRSFRNIKRSHSSKKIRRFIAPYSLKEREGSEKVLNIREKLQEEIKNKKTAADLVIKEIELKSQYAKNYDMIAEKELKKARKLQIFQPDFKAKEKNKKFKEKYLWYLKHKDNMKVILGEDHKFY